MYDFSKYSLNSDSFEQVCELLGNATQMSDIAM